MNVAYVSAFAVVLLFSGLVGIASPLGAEEVASFVVGRIVPELAIASDYIAFLYPGPIDPSDELAPYAPTPIPDEVDRLPCLLPYELSRSAWFLWIDLHP